MVFFVGLGACVALFAGSIMLRLIINIVQTSLVAASSVRAAAASL